MKVDFSDLWINLDNIETQIYIMKVFFLSAYTYYTSCKLINIKKELNKKNIVNLCIFCFFISLVVMLIKYLSSSLIGTICLCILISYFFSINMQYNIGYSLTIVIISLTINYIIFIFAIMIVFIPNIVFVIDNDAISLLSAEILHLFMLNILLSINKFKNGFLFLHQKFRNEYFDVLILNISVAILFLIVMISNRELLLSRNIFFAFIIFSIIMFITIQKSLQLYYKQRLLEQELKETKEELENKKKEIEKLEAENLNFSKTSHTLAHKQKSLEYKLEQLKQKYEIVEEIEIKDRIKNLSKELYGKTIEMELSKTGILEIDDMLKYMQSECIKNKIEFQLQIKGNIYEMVNNYISKEDLSTLIADHVKNAIIAINYSDNINKSILVRLGKIDKIYSLYIYDSGIEFEQETLSNLGKKPSTTHADNGGTGMGFMNTFDTLRKYKASLIINEYSKPCKDNYTKSIMIKFDKKEEFKINSYRQR